MNRYPTDSIRGRAGRPDAHVETTGTHVRAIIRDSGPGIPEAESDNVLRRLYRLEKSRTTEGSGLGLALVKAVADLHHAELTLTDAQPGLRVSLRFNQIDASG